MAVVTAFFGYHAMQLRLLSRFDELLPTNHPYVAVHRQFAKTFGGANTVLIMVRVREGDIFNVKTLDKIWSMTEEIDKIYGVNHYQIESLAHRTNRTLRVSAGGLMEMTPVMMGLPKTQADVDGVARIVHASQNLYGVLVSIDNRAALIRASFIEGIIDHRKLFEEIQNRVVKPFSDDNTEILVAGEPQLYGWVYQYAGQVYWILLATAVVAWVLLYLYFRDWKGALRPTISGLIAAIWGLGFIHLIGFSLDPLTLVIPFFITARAVSHSAQMHERYYEEYKACGWQQGRGDRPLLRGAVRADALRNIDGRARRARHLARSDPAAAALGAHRLVLDRRDRGERAVPEPGRVLVPEPAGAGDGREAREGSLPALDRSHGVHGRIAERATHQHRRLGGRVVGEPALVHTAGDR